MFLALLHIMSIKAEAQLPFLQPGAGFFIGDGAGVGKGRQIAGIMLDNYARGRRRHIWLSTSSDLHLDAQRDLRNIGCHINVINNCQTLDKEQKVVGLPKDLQEGVLFMCVPAPDWPHNPHLSLNYPPRPAVP